MALEDQAALVMVIVLFALLFLAIPVSDSRRAEDEEEIPQ